MSDEINELKLQKIVALAYNEIKKKETNGSSQATVTNNIIEIMKKELKEDANKEYKD